MNDSEILLKIKSGNEKVLEYLYKKYYRMMINIVTSNKGTEDEAKDIFQDALIVLWQNVLSDNFELTSKLSTYLYGVCKNLWIKELARKNKFTDEEQEKGEEQKELENSQTNKIISRCMDELGDPCKTIISYYYFENMSMDEIAKKMNFANTDTAKTKKYKCKKKLDELIRKYYSESDFF